ncbi:hypothetical protein [Clostridium tunisiense]|nr:hypothetical protein [Clostridium tunisiense]
MNKKTQLKGTSQLKPKDLCDETEIIEEATFDVSSDEGDNSFTVDIIID